MSAAGDDQGPRVDAQQVIRRLAQQIGEQAAQLAQYDALVAQLVEENTRLRANAEGA